MSKGKILNFLVITWSVGHWTLAYLGLTHSNNRVSAYIMLGWMCPKMTIVRKDIFIILLINSKFNLG